MKAILRILVSVFAIFFFSLSDLEASHAMGADLTYTCLGGNQYRFRLSFYRDCSGITPLNTQTVNASSATCGQNINITLNLLAGFPIEVSPLCAAQLPNSTCNGGPLPGVQEYAYQGTFTLPSACTDWVFSFSECCRNASITTMASPSAENLYVQSTLNNVTAPCNSSPSFTSLPVPFVCAGQTYNYNHGAIDPDGDSLVYSLINAQTVANGSVTYSPGFSGVVPLTSAPAVTIDPTNGNVTMTPTVPQTGVIAVLVQEYRNGVLIGSTIRDIQVTVLNCTNAAPTISPIAGLSGGTQVGPYSIEVCPGQNLSFTIPGSDPDFGQLITWSWNNGIPAGTFTGPNGASPQSATFSWTPTVADAGLHALTVNLSDNGCPVIGTQILAIDILVLEGTDAGPDQVFCIGGSPIVLNANGGSAFTWNILSGTPGSLSCTNCQSPTATPIVSTTYEVISNLPGACKNRDTVVVNTAPTFSLTMNPNATICAGSSTPLGATPSPVGSYTYAWAPSATLSASNVQSPTATPSTTTTYNVAVTSLAGCRITGSQTITVDPTILTVAPTVSPQQSCQGSPVLLDANSSSGDCNLYTGAAIAHAPVPAGGTPLVLGDDQLSAAIPLGFSFKFFCNTYTNIYVASNGILTFNPASGSGCCAGQILPNVALANDVIAVAWTDLYPPGAGTITYQTLGLAPNRRFVVTYNGIPFCCGATGDVIAQAILYETTNVVEIHTTLVNSLFTGTQGIENAAGTFGYVVPGRNGASWSAANDAYRFTPVAPAPFTMNWQAPLGSNIGSGDTLIIAPPATTTYFAVASNGVCSTTSSIVVQTAAANAGPDEFICPLGSGTSLNGSYAGPPAPTNCNLYTVSSVPYAPAAFAGTVYPLGDDEITAGIPLGFNFNFFCNTKTQVHLGGNGFITFNAASGSGCCSGTTLPTGTLSDFIAGSWNDLYPPGGGTVKYTTLGTAPNRIFVADYLNIDHCCTSTGPYNSFQFKLFETSNAIEIHTTIVTNDGSTHTQGIQSNAGVGIPVPGRNGNNFTASNDAFRFTPVSSSVTYSWSPATNLSATNIPNPTVSTVTGPINYVLTVDNGVCIMRDTVSLTACLPMDGLLLTGVQDGNAVRLNWDAHNEMDLAHYVIERSANGLDWSDIAQKQAIGAANATQAYGTFDRQPLTGGNYYRLRVVSNDGSTSHSNLVEVFFAGNEWVNVNPNPSRNVFNFEIATLEDGALDIEIYNTNGQLLQVVHENAASAGLHQKAVDLSKMAAGVYIYRVKTATQELNGRIVKMD